jgi:hypothetical protein
MLKATTRLADACAVLEHLVEWLARFPEAGESPEFAEVLAPPAARRA